MTYYDALFYVFALMTVVSAVVVVFSPNVIRAAFALMFTFLGVAGLYVLLLADFIAIAQVLIYVGGILVLLIFGVMLTQRVTRADLAVESAGGIPATITVGVLLGTLLLLLTRATWILREPPADIEGTTSAIGTGLLTTFLLPFEVAGFLLLVAVMGAAMIARKSPASVEER